MSAPTPQDLPSMYQNILLDRGYDDEPKLQAYLSLIAKFKDDQDGEIAKQVRSITVKENVAAEHLLLILDKISEHDTLREVNWNTGTHMSKGVYDKLHSTWPKLEISVTVLDRQIVKVVAHRRMDMRLLSSPLLVRLIYVVYNSGYEATRPSRSEWPRLTQALVAGGNVRVLRIQTQSDGREIDGYVSGYDGPQIVPDSEPEKLARLDITAGMRLPRLEELSINTQRHWGNSSYLWDTEHCLLLRDAMDWSGLRKLDFGSDNPHIFFDTFTGVIPNLESLRFEVMGGSVAAAKKFIESLHSLESLYVGQAQAGVDELWPAVMQQKSTLKELIFGPTLGREFRTVNLERSHLKEVVENIPQLERLGWDIPFETALDAEHLELISTLKLKKLDIFFRLSDAASDYSDLLRQDGFRNIAAPPLDKERSKKAAFEIAERVSEKQKSPLDWLTLHISRITYGDRMDPWLTHANLQLRRKTDAHEDAKGEDKYEVRGSMEWYGLLSLEEELSLE